MQEELIQQFKDGNRQAGDDYYNANIGLIVNIAKRYKNLNMDEEEVLAIVNQAFAYSLNRVDLKKAMFSTYLGITAKGMILRHFRDCERTIRTQRRDSTLKKIIYCDSLDEIVFTSESKDITKGDSIGINDDFTTVLVDESLSKLNKKDRQAFELKLYREFSQREIAEALGTNQVEISRRIVRAKATLKTILREVS